MRSMRDLVIQKHSKKSLARTKLSICGLMELISGFNGLENKTDDISDVTLKQLRVTIFAVEKQ
jgi:hypothetical protein